MSIRVSVSVRVSVRVSVSVRVIEYKRECKIARVSE